MPLSSKIVLVWSAVQAVGFVVAGIWAVIWMIREKPEDPAIEARALMRPSSWPSAEGSSPFDKPS
jgi:hypothetical protein